jgi:Cu/Ag efflux pump CusA
MVRWLIDLGQRLRLVVLALAVAIMVFGAWQLPDASREVLPEFGPVYVEIQTEALGLSAEEVEDLITVPLEQNLLNGVAWLDDIRSQSIAGLSSIVLIFEPGTDPLRARQMVAERLTQAHMLPAVSKPPTMLQPLSSASRVVMVRLSSDTLSPIQTSVLARWTIRPALLGVSGVANVSIWGQRERQLQVQIDPARLHERGILLEDVIATTGNALWVSPLTYLQASAPGTGGFVDTPNQRLGVQHMLPIDSTDDLALVPIEGCPVSYAEAEQADPGAAVCPTLGDVATIVEDHQPLIGDSVTADGQSLLLVIEKFPDADTEAVTRGVEKTLEGMAPGLEGVIIDSSVFQRASLIDTVIDNLNRILLIGIGLAILVTLLLLVDWRTAVVSAVVLPLSLVTAALVLYLRGATFDTVVMAGLVVALAIVIDDVVVDAAHVLRRVREHRATGSDRAVVSVVMEATAEVRSPAMVATVVVLLAAVPALLLGGLYDAFYLDGQSHAFLRPLVFSYAMAVIASLAVSLIVTPALTGLLLTRVSRAHQRRSPVAWLQPRFNRLLARSAPSYGLATAGIAVLLALGVAILPQMQAPASIVPHAQDRDLLVTWEAMAGTSLPEMTRITSRVSAEIKALPGVENVSAHVGRALTSDQVVDVHSGELWVRLSDSADYERTVAAVTEVVQGYPGVDHVVQTYLQERLEAVQTSPDDVVVRVYGQDMDVLHATAADIQDVLGSIDGIENARVQAQIQEPQVQVEVDLAAAERYGLKPGDVRRTATTLVNGIEVGSLFEDQKVFEVVVLGSPDIRQSLTSIENIPIDTPEGDQVPLGDVAAVEIVPTLDAINHHAVSRYVDVVADVKNRDVGAVAAEVERKLAGVDFQLDYHAEVLGDYAETERTQRQLIFVAIGAAVGVYLVLQAAFRSWLLAALAFICLPAALVGGIAAMWIDRDEVTLGALLGLLAVFGIAARHAIILVNRMQFHEQHTPLRSKTEAIMVAARERFAPIVVSTVATAVLMAPFALSPDLPGLEIVHPLAVTVLGGLVTTTAVSLLILPSLCLWYASRSAPRGVSASTMGMASGMPSD